MSLILKFLSIGFTHIIPDGLDHVLFVLGLFLLCRDFSTLLWQVTLFTMAHSLTLGLSMYGVVELPERPIEVLIALSIAFVAVENIFRSSLSQWRPLVIFGFGMIHGLGFASSFKAVGIPEGDFATALLSLNLGVELGQVAVIVTAYLLLSPFWERPWYRKAVTIPGSGLIVVTSLYWAITRMM